MISVSWRCSIVCSTASPGCSGPGRLSITMLCPFPLNSEPKLGSQTSNRPEQDEPVSLGQNFLWRVPGGVGPQMKKAGHPGQVQADGLIGKHPARISARKLA